MTVRNVSDEEWESYVNRCKEATFFHTIEWYSIWKQYLEASIECRMYEFTSGRTALLPLLRTNKLFGLIKKYDSSPVGTYGGIISKDSLSREELIEVKNSYNKISNLSITENPFNSYSIDADSKDFTQVVELDKTDTNFARKWSKGHSSAYKKGVRLNLEVKEEENWNEYIKLYYDTYSRWDLPPVVPYRKELFTFIGNIDRKFRKLWIVRYNGKPIAGSIVFYKNLHAVYWSSAMVNEFQSLRPVHTMIHYIINDALSKNYTYFDFNPSAGLDGVISFKKGFNSTVYKFGRFQRSSRLMNYGNRIRYYYNKVLKNKSQ